MLGLRLLYRVNLWLKRTVGHIWSSDDNHKRKLHIDFTLASIFESSKKSETTIHASMTYTLFPSTSDVVYDAMLCEGKIHPAKLLSGDIPGIGNEMFSWP